MTSCVHYLSGNELSHLETFSCNALSANNKSKQHGRSSQTINLRIFWWLQPSFSESPADLKKGK